MSTAEFECYDNTFFHFGLYVLARETVAAVLAGLVFVFDLTLTSDLIDLTLMLAPFGSAGMFPLDPLGPTFVASLMGSTP